jgi:hypothetical protein
MGAAFLPRRSSTAITTVIEPGGRSHGNPPSGSRIPAATMQRRPGQQELARGLPQQEGDE